MVIRIHKEDGTRKNAIRVTTTADIPDFLRGTIVVKDMFVFLVCVEGNQICPTGSVIGWEKSNSTPTGYNCWCIDNAEKFLTEIDGVFYKKAVVFEAEKIGDVFPDFLKGADITRNPNGSWSIRTSSGISTGYPGKAYWVKYGKKPDGTPKANILTKTEESYTEYIVCDEHGHDIGRLCEIDPVDPV